jgi:hypothetical protein
MTARGYLRAARTREGRLSTQAATAPLSGRGESGS